MVRDSNLGLFRGDYPGSEKYKTQQYMVEKYSFYDGNLDFINWDEGLTGSCINMRMHAYYCTQTQKFRNSSCAEEFKV